MPASYSPTLPSRENKNKIAFYGFREGGGGRNNVLINLVNALSDEGICVDLVLNSNPKSETDLFHKNVRIINFESGTFIGKVYSLTRYIEREGPELIICDSNLEKTNRIAALSKILSNNKVKLVFRIGITLTELMRQRNFINRFLFHRSIRLTFPYADLIVANAQGVALDVRQLTGIPLEKIKVLKNTTVSNAIGKKAEESIEHPWFKPGAPPVVLGVGRLRRKNDFVTLLRAFAKVREHKESRLVILGDGSERGKLLSLAEELGILDSIDLPGFAANPFAYMRRASLFVLSSLFEGSPNSLIEALAVGTPVVATDCHSGPREILQDEKFGPLVPVGDVDAMAKAMLETLENPPDRDFLKSAADPYRTENCTRAYLQALGIKSD